MSTFKNGTNNIILSVLMIRWRQIVRIYYVFKKILEKLPYPITGELPQNFPLGTRPPSCFFRAYMATVS